MSALFLPHWTDLGFGRSLSYSIYYLSRQPPSPSPPLDHLLPSLYTIVVLFYPSHSSLNRPRSAFRSMSSFTFSSSRSLLFILPFYWIRHCSKYLSSHHNYPSPFTSNHFFHYFPSQINRFHAVSLIDADWGGELLCAVQLPVLYFLFARYPFFLVRHHDVYLTCVMPFSSHFFLSLHGVPVGFIIASIPKQHTLHSNLHLKASTAPDARRRQYHITIQFAFLPLLAATQKGQS